MRERETEWKSHLFCLVKIAENKIYFGLLRPINFHSAKCAIFDIPLESQSTQIFQLEINWYFRCIFTLYKQIFRIWLMFWGFGFGFGEETIQIVSKNIW